MGRQLNKLHVGQSSVNVSEFVADQGDQQDQLTQGTVSYFENARLDDLENFDQPTERIQKLKITTDQIRSRCSKPILASGKRMNAKGGVYLL